MAVKQLFLFLALSSVIHVKSEEDVMEVVKKIANVLPLFEEILTSNATSLCEEHLREYINGLRSYSNWALRMLDATAKSPEGLYKGNSKFLGFYEECISTEHPQKIFTGKHCVARFGGLSQNFAELIVKSDLINIKNFYEAFADFLDLLLGICLPSTCSAPEIYKILSNVTESIFPGAVKIVLSESSCSTKEPVGIPTGIWIVVGVLFGFVVLVMISTAYEFYQEFNGAKPDQLLGSFSVLSNYRLLLSEADNSDEIPCLHGIRAISMGWIVFSHAVFFTIIGPSMNIVDTVDMIQNVNFVPIVNSFLGVDTFFFLSGFLVYVSFHRCIAQRGFYDVPMAFIHRYLRITPPFAIVLLIQSTLFRYLGSGPIWGLTVDIIENECDRSWWKSLLYVQNYLAPLTGCLGQTWYLSVDMQLYWVSPILLFSFLFWPGFSAVLVILLILATSLASFLIIYLNGLGPTILITTSIIAHFKDEYAPMHTRASPWLIGAALSYIILYFEDKKIKVKLSKFWVTAGWVAAIGLSVGSMYGITAFTDFKYTLLESSLYVPLHRIGWTLGLSWIVFACFYGYGGFVNSILSAKIFVPIGRLAYSVYLIHLSLQLYRLASSKTSYYDDVRQFLYFFIGDLILSFSFGFILKLMIEMPFGRMEKILLKNVTILPIPRKKNKHVVNDFKEDVINSSNETENGEVNRGFEYNSERL